MKVWFFFFMTRARHILQFLLVLKWCWSLRSFRMTFPLMPQQVKFIWRDEWDQMQHCSAKASNNSAGTKIKSRCFLGIRYKAYQTPVCKSCLVVVNCLFLIASCWVVVNSFVVSILHFFYVHLAANFLINRLVNFIS